MDGQRVWAASTWPAVQHLHLAQFFFEESMLSLEVFFQKKKEVQSEFEYMEERCTSSKLKKAQNDWKDWLKSFHMFTQLSCQYHVIFAARARLISWLWNQLIETVEYNILTVYLGYIGRGIYLHSFKINLSFFKSQFHNTTYKRMCVDYISLAGWLQTKRHCEAIKGIHAGGGNKSGPNTHAFPDISTVWPLRCSAKYVPVAGSDIDH